MTTTKQNCSIFLADKIADMTTIDAVIVTKEENAIGNKAANVDEVDPCTHEESDTCLFIHA